MRNVVFYFIVNILKEELLTILTSRFIIFKYIYILSGDQFIWLSNVLFSYACNLIQSIHLLTENSVTEALHQ